MIQWLLLGAGLTAVVCGSFVLGAILGRAKTDDELRAEMNPRREVEDH